MNKDDLLNLLPGSILRRRYDSLDVLYITTKPVEASGYAECFSVSLQRESGKLYSTNTFAAINVLNGDSVEVLYTPLDWNAISIAQNRAVNERGVL